MDWLLPFRPLERGSLTAPGLPRRLLRRLVHMANISLGSKVLDAGCGSGDLTRFFDELSINVAGCDASPERIATAKSAARHLEYSCSRAVLALPFPEQSFDAVLARELPEHRGDLFSPDALRATAHLLAMVRPLGCLVMLSRLEPGWSNQPGGHLQTCFQQHLDCFPGVREVSYLVDSFADRTTWKWMLGRQPRAGYITAAITVSETRRSCREWEQIADQAAANHQQICCNWSQPAVGQADEAKQHSRNAA